MKKQHLVLAILLVLVVAASGCAGKQAAPVTQSQTQSPAFPAGEDIVVPDSQGVAIDNMTTASDENVDLGSLI